MASNYNTFQGEGNPLSNQEDLERFQDDEEERTVENGKCCDRLVAEWRLFAFSLTDTIGQTIDVKETFSPSEHRVVYGIIKAAILLWTTSIVVLDIRVFASIDAAHFWLAFLTHWGLVFTLATNLLSLSMFVYFLPYVQTNLGGLEENVKNGLVRFTWAIFTITINIALLITLLYWILDYNGGAVDYLNAMKHGGLALITTLDVLVVNRIPIRLKQLTFVMITYVLYFSWSIIHAISGMGTPLSDGDYYTDDDSIYPVMNWKKRRLSALIVSLASLTIVSPSLFMFLWYLSTLLKSRYVEI